MAVVPLGQVEEAEVGLKVHLLGAEGVGGLQTHERVIPGEEVVEEVLRIHQRLVLGEGEVAREGYCAPEGVEAHQLDRVVVVVVVVAQRGLEPGVVVVVEHGVSAEVKMGPGVAAVEVMQE